MRKYIYVASLTILVLILAAYIACVEYRARYVDRRLAELTVTYEDFRYVDYRQSDYEWMMGIDGHEAAIDHYVRCRYGHDDIISREYYLVLPGAEIRDRIPGILHINYRHDGGMFGAIVPRIWYREKDHERIKRQVLDLYDVTYNQKNR